MATEASKEGRETGRKEAIFSARRIYLLLVVRSAGDGERERERSEWVLRNEHYPILLLLWTNDDAVVPGAAVCTGIMYKCDRERTYRDQNMFFYFNAITILLPRTAVSEVNQYYVLGSSSIDPQTCPLAWERGGEVDCCLSWENYHFCKFVKRNYPWYNFVNHAVCVFLLDIVCG